MAVVNLTEARIRELPLNSGIWRDEQVKGLMVVCHATTKTYAVQGDVRRNGRHVRTVRMKIDRTDRIGLREAHARAKANRVFSAKASHRALATAGRALGLETVKTGGGAERRWVLPPLAEARRLFEERLGASGLFA